MKNGNIALSALCVSMLAGCGGGGGDVPAMPPPSTVNAAAAWSNAITVQRTVAAAGTGSDGRAYSVAYTVAPAAGSATVEGVAAKRIDLSVVLKRDGVTTSAATVATYLKAGTTEVIAFVREDQNCGIVESPSVPPASAVLQQSGPLYATRVLIGCSKLGISLEDERSTWSIDADGSTAYFCVTTARKVISTPEQTQQICLQTTAAGALGGAVRFTINNGAGFSVVMR